jgi:hypothetical protein
MQNIKQIDEVRLENDLAYRFGYLAEFIGFAEADILAIHHSAAALGPHVNGLVDAVYDKLFGFDATKRHFLKSQSGYAGSVPVDLQSLTVDHEIIQFRKQHLALYLVNLVSKPYEQKMVTYLDQIGKIHTVHAGSPQLNVPLVQMNALMGFVSDALTQTILSLNQNRTEEIACLLAFNKLLWIQNDLINRHYQSN